MFFNSLTFVVFFAVVLGLYLPPLLSWRAKKTLLLVASYLFYAAWNPPFVLLIVLSTVVDFFVARWLARAQRGRGWLLLASLVVNLGLLAFFKYGTFALDNFTLVVHSLGIPYQPAAPDIILPVGISFYTFQTLSYTIDVYRKQLEPRASFLDFALFVTFFPQLVAGPIVRAADFLPQLDAPRGVDRSQLGWGLSLMVLGLWEKEALADGILGGVVNQVYGDAAAASFVEAWMGTFAFSGQIFFDFAGYSTCAIGAAMCLGFVLPDNFRFPYAAVGFSDFWRRWHISLSSWLRDYLYISMGGNRKGRLRTYANLMNTMLLGGLWHGASWQFVVWGFLHGLYLMVERGIQVFTKGKPWARAWPVKLLTALATYVFVCIAWVFFRATTFTDAWEILTAMFGIGTGAGVGVGAFQLAAAGAVTALLLLGHHLLRDTTVEAVAARVPWWGRGLILAGMLAGIFLSPGERLAFIYFQF